MTTKAAIPREWPGGRAGGTGTGPLDVRLKATWVKNVGYRYDVFLGDEAIVSRSRDPEYDAARALLALGLTGRFRTIDFVTGRHRMTFDIEKAARLRTVERNDRGLTVEPYRPISTETKGLLRAPTSGRGAPGMVEAAPEGGARLESDGGEGWAEDRPTPVQGGDERAPLPADSKLEDA